MKSARGTIARSVERPDPDIRLYLFHGADQSQSRALAQRLVQALGAARHVIAAADLRSDPALLAAEAGAMSLFGEARAIWIEPAGDEIAAAAESLLSLPAIESPVVAIAGALRKTSALLKLAEAHRQALAHACYLPEGRDAEQLAGDLGRTFGLRMTQSVAARIAAAAANDQAVMNQELAKLALFLDAAPESPRELDHDALDALGADRPEGDLMRLADLALAGDLAGLADALARLSAGGSEAVPAIRALQRRLLLLAPLRARVEAGSSVGDVMASAGKSLFWKEKPLIEQLLARWDSASLARIAERAARVERDLMLTPAPQAESLGEELVAVARAARRR